LPSECHGTALSAPPPLPSGKTIIFVQIGRDDGGGQQVCHPRTGYGRPIVRVAAYRPELRHAETNSVNHASGTRGTVAASANGGSGDLLGAIMASS
jgi:hypothetical protein